MVKASPTAESAKHLSGSGLAAKHRLFVFAKNPVDVIASAGGLLVDRAGAGWDVQAYLDDVATEADTRAMQILGVRKLLPAPAFELAKWPEFLIVGAELYRRNLLVRRLFQAATQRNRTEVAMWGGCWPTDLGPGIGEVEHRLSSAAKAFKSHAMRTAGLTPDVTDVECFRHGKRRYTIAEPLLPPA